MCIRDSAGNAKKTDWGSRLKLRCPMHHPVLLPRTGLTCCKLTTKRPIFMPLIPLLWSQIKFKTPIFPNCKSSHLAAKNNFPVDNFPPHAYTNHIKIIWCEVEAWEPSTRNRPRCSRHCAIPSGSLSWNSCAAVKNCLLYTSIIRVTNQIYDGKIR